MMVFFFSWGTSHTKDCSCCTVEWQLRWGIIYYLDAAPTSDETMTSWPEDVQPELCMKTRREREREKIFWEDVLFFEKLSQKKNYHHFVSRDQVWERKRLSTYIQLYLKAALHKSSSTLNKCCFTAFSAKLFILVSSLYEKFSISNFKRMFRGVLVGQWVAEFDTADVLSDRCHNRALLLTFPFTAKPTFSLSVTILPTHPSVSCHVTDSHMWGSKLLLSPTLGRLHTFCITDALLHL